MKRRITAAFAVFMSVSLLGACGDFGRAQMGRETGDEKWADVSDTTAAEEATGKNREKEEKKNIPEFQVGETWTVDGQWSLTILGATATDERNEFSEQMPGAVYIVDYAYTNLGYDDSIMDGLYISLEDHIVDSAGKAGYYYPASISHFPESVPVGGTCHAQACIGVNNPGVLRVTKSIFDNDMNGEAAVFVIDPEKEMAEMPVPDIPVYDSGTMGIGETWTVDGQWTLTLTGVAATDDRNEFDEKNPAAVYVVDYEYTNLGYEDWTPEEETGAIPDSAAGAIPDSASAASDSGLFITIDNQIVDSAGVMGYSYSGSVSNYPEEIPIGATCHAQECIGVDHPGDFRLTVSLYDSNGEKRRQTFLIKVG